MEEYQKAIKRSRIRRVNWKKLLGVSLMAYITEELARGSSRTKIVNEVMDHIARSRQYWRHKGIVKAFSGLSTAKVLENLKTSVSARIAEMKIEDGVRNRVKMRR
jgi:hypothetical protein